MLHVSQVCISQYMLSSTMSTNETVCVCMYVCVYKTVSVTMSVYSGRCESREESAGLFHKYLFMQPHPPPFGFIRFFNTGLGMTPTPIFKEYTGYFCSPEVVPL